MKNIVVITQGAFEKIIADLIFFEEQKDYLVEYYFSEALPRKNCSQFIEKYISQLDDLIRIINVDAAANNALPFIIVGSEVFLKQLGDSGEVINLTITLPLENTDQHSVSCLSYTGMALLLKRPGEIVTINSLWYLITTINYPIR